MGTLVYMGKSNARSDSDVRVVLDACIYLTFLCFVLLKYFFVVSNHMLITKILK